MLKIENKLSENEKESKENEEKIRKSSFNEGFIKGIIPIFLISLYSVFSLNSNLKKNEKKNISNYVQNLRVYDINQDGRMDLISQNGEIFLQTVEGNFITYERVFNKEKMKQDSIYDLIRNSAIKEYIKLEQSK